MNSLPDYESDRAIQEIQDEMYRMEEERPKGGISQLQPQTKFFIGLFFGAVVLLILLNKITLQQGAITIVVAGIILYLLTANNPDRKELTWLECMIRINDLLVFLQKHPVGQEAQIPKGKVKITPIGRKQWYEGKPWKRSYGVEIYDDDIDTTEMYFIEVDVFTGDIITFRHSPEGVYGDETKDVKIIPGYDMVMQKIRNKYLGRKPGGGMM